MRARTKLYAYGSKSPMNVIGTFCGTVESKRAEDHRSADLRCSWWRRFVANLKGGKIRAIRLKVGEFNICCMQDNGVNGATVYIRTSWNQPSTLSLLTRFYVWWVMFYTATGSSRHSDTRRRWHYRRLLFWLCESIWHCTTSEIVKENGTIWDWRRVWLWVKDFLTNRLQCVIANGNKSTYKAVTSEIPQGSGLGKLLFLIFINDLTDKIVALVRLFAD